MDNNVYVQGKRHKMLKTFGVLKENVSLIFGRIFSEKLWPITRVRVLENTERKTVYLMVRLTSIYLLKTIHEIVARMTGPKFFTLLHCTGGFWQKRTQNTSYLQYFGKNHRHHQKFFKKLNCKKKREMFYRWYIDSSINKGSFVATNNVFKNWKKR